MDVSPRRSAFVAAYEAGRPQVVWTTLVSDLETPVAAMMKLAESQRHGFLLESVEGGAARGRYSYIGLRPDLVWRCRGERAEVNRGVRLGQVSYEPSPLPALASLRALIQECRIELPPELPPGSASLIGFFAVPSSPSATARLPSPPTRRRGSCRTRCSCARPWCWCSTTCSTAWRW